MAMQGTFGALSNVYWLPLNSNLPRRDG